MKDVPHIYGDDCLIGFPPDKTPKYMWARFSGIIKCSSDPGSPWLTPPNDRVFKLEQSDIFPCRWECFTGSWAVVFYLPGTDPWGWLSLWQTPANAHFFTDTLDGPLDEGAVYHNREICGIGFAVAHNGIATVTWTREATNLLEALNIQRGNDLFMEMRPLADGNKVYKFCRLKDATNIAIQFEPD